MGTVPTKEAIIGQFINGRNATDDFLQLADNHGGNVFAWIDSAGVLRGTFATNALAAGSNTDIQFNNGGAFAGDSQFTWDTTTKYLIAGPPKSSFDAIIGGSLDAIGDGAYSFRVLNSTTRFSTVHAVNQCDISISPLHACRAFEGYVEATNVNPIAAASVYCSTASTVVGGGDLTANTVVAAFGGTAQTAAGSMTSVSRMRTVDVDLGHNGSGTIGVGVTFLGGIGNNSTGTISLASCFYAQGSLNVGGGTITLNAGFYSEKQGGAGVTNYAYFAADQGSGANDYAFYSAGGKNLFAGNGTTAALSLVNLTAATNIANQSSPFLNLSGTYWDGAASQIQTYALQVLIGAGTNPTSSLHLTGGDFSLSGNINAGSNVTSSGAFNAGGNVNLYGNSPATSITNVVFGHVNIGGNYWDGAASQVDSWTQTLSLGAGANPTSTLAIAHIGTPGVATLVLPNTQMTTLTITGATPTTTSGQVGFGTTAGFGNGSAGTAVTTTTKSTGTGPATPQTIVNYLEIDIAGTKYWMPLVQ